MKKDIKKDLLKMLRNDMKGMMMEEKGSSLHDMMPEKKAKVTVMADSEEGLLEGLSKAEQMMKMKFGEESEEKEKKKK